MNYEQKRLVVRVYLPGPMERVVDWAAVAADMYANDSVVSYLTLIDKHTTERPSRIDTGVDLVIDNDVEDGDLIVSWPRSTGPWLTLGCHPDQIAALGFPTEPQEVVETQAEGEVSP